MPRWVDRLRLRLRTVLRGRRVDAELARELRFHLEEQVEENLRAGMAPPEAREAALRSFGGVTSIAERCRDTRRTAWFESLVRDLRYAVRALAAQPLLVVAATASIAVGVGANTVVFSLASELLLRPPTVREPDRLVYIRMGGSSHVSYAQWQALHESGAMAGLTGFQIERDVNWRTGDRAVTLIPLIVPANYFELLGVPVARGRAFTAAEASPDRNPRVAVVSHGFWQRQLGGDPAVIGRSLELNGEPYEIAGVLPSALRSFPGYAVAPEIYLPLSAALLPDMDEPISAAVQLVGRLRDGDTLAQGRAALETAGRNLARDRGWKSFASVGQFAPVTDGPGEFGGVSAFFALLLLVVGLVLAIACANVTGLLLARGANRRRELAIRAAIGAGRWRLIQQLMAETFWLALLGTACGLGLALGLVDAIASVPLPLPLPLELRTTLDGRLLGYLLVLVIAATILSGLPAALQATRIRLLPAVKQDEPRVGRWRWSLRAFLVVGQVTVSAVLLVTAALFLRNLARTNAADPGFDASRTLVAQVGFVEGRHDKAARAALVQEAVARLEAMPGVVRASAVQGVPLTLRSGRTTGIDIRIADVAETFHARYEDNRVGPGYFAAMGIAVVRGRDFAATDVDGRTPVVIINEEFVRRYLSGREPVGLTLMLPGPGHLIPGTIVGVVANSKHRTLGEPQQAAIYAPWLQSGNWGRLTQLVIRTDADPQEMRAGIARTISALDAAIAVDVQTMRSALAFAFLPSRVGAALLGTLGLLAVVLAGGGLFAMVSYAVTRRTTEIGIRMALGAPRRSVARLVIRESALLVIVGLTLGLGLAALLTGSLTTFLVSDLSATDPVSFIATAILFVAVTIAACIGPMRRAIRVEPAIALRAE